MDTIVNLGINTVNLDIDDAIDLGLGRIEISLGKGNIYMEKLNKFKKDICKAQRLNIPYSIHLPVYVENWYKYDYFSAFFIDKDESKRKLSFRLLEYNLEKLKDYSPEYYVLHFPGLSERWGAAGEFEKVLLLSLDRIEGLAERYGVKIYLEYFGSNKNFYDYNQWIKTIDNYSNLGILVDTGHLYFSAIKNGFDFLQAFKVLAQSCDAFHLWTTKGDKAYCQSEYYKKYHHIAPHAEQVREDGWAFDTLNIGKIMAKQNKPVIIEPSIKYKGKEYLIEGIKSIRDIFKNYKL